MNPGLEFISDERQRDSGSGKGRDCDVAARRTTLSARDRYKLRLLVNHTRFYMADPSLRSLASRGLVAPTGRTDESNRAEWTITATGQGALSATESLLTTELDPSAWLRKWEE
jgi:hypothetical protein